MSCTRGECIIHSSLMIRGNTRATCCCAFEILESGSASHCPALTQVLFHCEQRNCCCAFFLPPIFLWAGAWCLVVSSTKAPLWSIPAISEPEYSLSSREGKERNSFLADRGLIDWRARGHFRFRTLMYTADFPPSYLLFRTQNGGRSLVPETAGRAVQGTCFPDLQTRICHTGNTQAVRNGSSAAASAAAAHANAVSPSSAT